MSKIDDARTAVNVLSKLSSPIEKFVAAYAKIVDAGTTLVEADRIALLTVVSNLVDNKIPTDITFQPLEDSAQRFQQNLAAQIIGTGMANIAARNAELQSLIALFSVQITATNNDAGKLQQITAQITKATTAVNEIKTLVTQLSAPNANVSARIQAVLTALRNLEQTF